MSSRNKFLIVGAVFSAAAAVLHLACIAVGGSLYRLLGAGERMATMAEAGHWYPTVVTSAIAAVLFLWSAYALSGAGAIPRLPLLRVGLSVITAIYLVRGVAFPAMGELFPGNSLALWLWSSGICLTIGLVHLIGLVQEWAHLRPVKRRALHE